MVGTSCTDARRRQQTARALACLCTTRNASPAMTIWLQWLGSKYIVTCLSEVSVAGGYSIVCKTCYGHPEKILSLLYLVYMATV